MHACMYLYVLNAQFLLGYAEVLCLVLLRPIFYFVYGRVVKYCDPRVCLSVCLSVCV